MRRYEETIVYKSSQSLVMVVRGSRFHEFCIDWYGLWQIIFTYPWCSDLLDIKCLSGYTPKKAQQQAHRLELGAMDQFLHHHLHRLLLVQQPIWLSYIHPCAPCVWKLAPIRQHRAQDMFSAIRAFMNMLNDIKSAHSQTSSATFQQLSRFTMKHRTWRLSDAVVSVLSASEKCYGCYWINSLYSKDMKLNMQAMDIDHSRQVSCKLAILARMWLSLFTKDCRFDTERIVSTRSEPTTIIE